MSSWYDDYLKDMAQSNNSYYREFAQEWIKENFTDSTLVNTIKEQVYPFGDVYNEIRVQLDTVSDVTVNITKVIGDYKSIMFEDCKHRNYRGQKYDINGVIHLCYDRVEPLSKIAKSKVIRCNNELKWINQNTKEICREPIFLGEQISSTNDAISSDATIPNSRMIIVAQYNSLTKQIKLNQRFMFENSTVFKVEEINNYIREEMTDTVTMIKVYLKRDSVTSADNVAENLCDYYTNELTVNIDNEDLKLTNGTSGKLNATVKQGENVIIDVPLEWTSSNSDVVSIDSLGNYQVVGNNGYMARITCQIKDNDLVKDSIDISVVEEVSNTKELIITPQINSLRESTTQIFECSLHIDGSPTTELITCTPSWDGCNYILTQDGNRYKLTNNKMSSRLLDLVFSTQDGLLTKTMKIRLKGVV